MRAVGFVLSGVLLFSGCAASGLGDPCTPEVTPPGGFHASEVSVETSSVQCRTRVCVVFHLDGDPRHVQGTESCPAGATDCVIPADPSGASTALANSLDRVFCSCRCDEADGNGDLPLCRCTDGFVCVPPGQRGGGFCVPAALASSSP